MIEMKQKKGHRCDPAFVNLKSNTMKNTMQKYYYYLTMQYFSLFYNFS